MAHYLKLSALTVVGFVVAVVLVFGGLLVAAVIRNHAGTSLDRCPSSSPNACDAKVASLLGVPQSSLPTIQSPASLKYVEGRATSEDSLPSGIFVFRPVALGNDAQAITLTISRVVPPKPGGPRGVTKHVGPSLTFRDYTVPGRAGPLVERTGDLEVVVVGNIDVPVASYNALQVQLLESVVPAKP